MEAVLTFFVQGFQMISMDFMDVLWCSPRSQICSDTNQPMPLLYLFAPLSSQEAARPQSWKNARRFVRLNDGLCLEIIRLSYDDLLMIILYVYIYI